ncbi:hypothetical protein [Magnetospirillum aberrantis]|uniref:Uncharacterized protein n=1 Tax=Magnetospirillum aberrantis SpK TaxID=908842 RepID=A0A7C9QT58_9PROT|nr:hypothetical protein [Magnetospirillum aberrantis]NFV80058.1 hypothetical protein [Magnetospirillum aberrantis SpK]
MDANKTPCSIEAPVTGLRVAFRDHLGMLKTIKLMDGSDAPDPTMDEWASPHRDFSPWLTPEALAAFDPDAHEAGEYLLERAKAAAVNNERERRRSARGGSK